MTNLLWFLLGLCIAISGQAIAQSYYGYDNQGNSTMITPMPGGGLQGFDNQGRSFQFYGTPPVMPMWPKSPC